MKKTLALAYGIFALLFSVNVMAQQEIPLTMKAVKLVSANDLIGARTVINEAIETQESSSAYTWYVRGFVHKEIFKEIENMGINSENREIAVRSILKSRELDVKGEYLEDSQLALSFLAKSFFNHSRDMVNSHDPEWLAESESYFNRYMEIMSEVEPGRDFTDSRLAFYKNLAQAYEVLYDRDRSNEKYVDLGIEYYTRALELNPDDYETNYNTAINYYNRSVFRIKQIDRNTEIFELLVIQEQCIELFKKSLPYMLKAYNHDPQRKETLIGLMAIYRALNEYEKSDSYKETLADLIEKGVIKDD